MALWPFAALLTFRLTVLLISCWYCLQINHLLNTPVTMRPAKALVSNGVLPLLHTLVAEGSPAVRLGGAWEAMRAITKHPELAHQIATDKQFCAVITAKLLEDVASWKESLKDTNLDKATPMKPYSMDEITHTNGLAAALQTIGNILNAGKTHCVLFPSNYVKHLQVVSVHSH